MNDCSPAPPAPEVPYDCLTRCIYTLWLNNPLVAEALKAIQNILLMHDSELSDIQQEITHSCRGNED